MASSIRRHKEKNGRSDEREGHDSNQKYQKRRRRRQRQGARGGPACDGMVYWIMCLVVLLLVVYRMAQTHHDFRRYRDTQQRIRRAHALQRLKGAGNHGGKTIKEGPSNPRKILGREELAKIRAKEAKGGSDDRKHFRSDEQDLETLEEDITGNRHGGRRWINPKHLPPLPGNGLDPDKHNHHGRGKPIVPNKKLHKDIRFTVHRGHVKMDWESEWEKAVNPDKGPSVDYTRHSYEYPELMRELPPTGGYPRLMKLGDMFQRWPQDSLDQPPSPFVENLLHFDYSKPEEREVARKFRDAELPFKLYNIPELTNATLKWTDEYLSEQFDKASFFQGLRGVISENTKPPKSNGMCQESQNNFFTFFTPTVWDVKKMGLPPTRNNDWTFEKWASHARYADHVGLDFDQPHFYWQSGVPKEERLKYYSQWTFVSRDLPSFSSPESTFFMFHPEQQKGIQCRFGERGVTAATHYDAGRNMVAMISGAKRYVLSPPKACSRLGIITQRGQPAYRHSVLNFAHINLLETQEGGTMSPEERAWLERARDSMAVDTVLKAGEVLYIPSHWFHYISSLQKSAQCNVRSGRETEGRPEFGGYEDVNKCDGE